VEPCIKSEAERFVKTLCSAPRNPRAVSRRRRTGISPFRHSGTVAIWGPAG